jgi:putative transposase
LLRREGWVVNHKRVYRLYVEEGLNLRKRQRRSRAQVERVPLAAPTGADERYSMDFMHDRFRTGGSSARSTSSMTTRGGA